VNIKVVLNAVVANGDMTTKQRDRLLAQMTDEVGDLVLRNNYLQTQALGLASTQSASMLDVHSRLMRLLEREARLDVNIEALPDAEEMQKRRAQGRGLVAPELSVLMAYTKIYLYQSLIGSTFPDDEHVRGELRGYFPSQLKEKFDEEIVAHPLRREIVSTVIANEMVNREGMTFIFRLGEKTSASIPDMARAYFAAREMYDMPSFWRAVEALGNQVPAPEQLSMLLEARRLHERAARWILNHCPRPLQVAEIVGHYTDGISALGATLMDVLPESGKHKADEVTSDRLAHGVPQPLAQRSALMTEFYAALDIVDTATAAGKPIQHVAEVYFGLHERMSLVWLRNPMIALVRDNRWQALSRVGILDGLYAEEGALTLGVLANGPVQCSAAERIDIWVSAHNAAVERYRAQLDALIAGPTPDFAMLTVMMREFRKLCRSVPDVG
ncbi:MAG: NAD-glutamate dehydrogenase, partial [Chromatiales bacterium]|nr:NAD-glutamate dehydrogenase [Chromatiales bacterium]